MAEWSQEGVTREVARDRSSRALGFTLSRITL